ncbi:conserved hypothetical protein [Paracoccus isoporae]|uniref:Mucoidy inhibitor MuiA family protein n=1 Tax=Paracoccus isoporae TaxID=591205 RepID=A0A1G7ER69_9RHOB|nr:DUF4139 domain-containing protein [Paracoccus isoporae]SDE65926.1 conserved hypothetical protein [Paracoccus isoporae]
MRLAILVLTGLTASPVLAERMELSAPVREATLYPQGASVTRLAQTDLPQGSHEIVIPGLPDGIRPDSLRITADGARLGAVSLQRGRALPGTAPDSASVQEARDEVARLERALRERDARVAAIRAEAEAAEDLIGFLRGLAQSDSAAEGDVAALADTVGARMLAARRDAIAAETRAQAAAQGREADVQALDRARARLDALQQPEQTPRSTLVMAVEGQGGPARFRITAEVDQAGWEPVYDLRLDQPARRLTLERGLMLHQASGEDWDDVSVILSTARPSGQSAPSELHPRHVRIIDPADPVFSARAMPQAEMAMAGAAASDMAMPMPVPETAKLDHLGATAIYRYDAPVDLRDGVDALRLVLDRRDLPVEALVAEAVPARDSSAYLVVDSENALDEVILPGPVTLYADGAMVGQGDLPLTAAGDDMKLGFGAIDGIVLERRVPDRESGGRGVIRRSSGLAESVLLTARNLTGREYDLRLIDRVPVSEQTDLKIDWQASIPPGETDPEGRRGLLVWDLDLPAGETQEIRLDISMSWPEEMELIE